MKAVIATSNSVEIIKVREPLIMDPEDVKIRVEYAGITGSDVKGLSELKGMYGNYAEKENTPQLGFGYLAAGTIVQMGKKAAEAGWKVGDRVSGDPFSSCGICRFCKSGNPNVCTNNPFSTSVTMSQYFTWNHNQLFKLPDTISTQEGVLFYPLSTCLHAMGLVNVYPGSSVLIFGGGIHGLIFLQLALMAGATNVTVVERDKSKRKIATELGAHHALDFMMPYTYIELSKISEGEGFDTVIDAATNPELFKLTSSMLGRLGTLLLFSAYAPGTKISFEIMELLFKEVTIRTAIKCPSLNPRTMSVMKHINLKKLITGVFDLSDVTKAFEAKASGKHAMVLVKF